MGDPDYIFVTDVKPIKDWQQHKRYRKLRDQLQQKEQRTERENEELVALVAEIQDYESIPPRERPGAPIEIPDDFMPQEVPIGHRMLYQEYMQMIEQLNDEKLELGEAFQRDTLRDALFKATRSYTRLQMLIQPLDGGCRDRNPIRLSGCLDHDD
jgi:hypothetical protein